jgi:hypothetical protein
MQNKVKASFSTSCQCSERIVNPFGGHAITHNILWHIIRHKHHTNVDSTWPKFKSVQVAYLHIDLNNISGSASYILHDDDAQTKHKSTRHPEDAANAFLMQHAPMKEQLLGVPHILIIQL